MAFAPSPRPAPRPRTSPRSSARQAPGEVRLIGGLWKRSKLPVLDAPGLRPTPDRLRETLFNWLGQDLAGLRCLDAFAGTGALGLEAASRGAAEVLLLERDARLAQALRTTCERLAALGVRVQVADALRWMTAQSAGVAFDVVFVDPPFDRGMWGAALDAARPLLAADGRLYLEADRAFEAAELGERGYALLRHARAGQVHGMLLAPAAAPADALP